MIRPLIHLSLFRAGARPIFTTRPLFFTTSATETASMSSSKLMNNLAYVDGAWVKSLSGKTFDVFNPTTAELIASVPDMDDKDTGRAIEAAAKAFPAWRDTTAKYRSDLLRRWFELCKEHEDELAEILQIEQGKPIKEAKGEVGYGSTFLEWFSEECRRINGEVVVPPSTTKHIMIVKEPIGVAAMITPWNFPNAMITRKAGAALAAGCTCVVKPAEDTPLSALSLAYLAEKAGIPKGVFNVVTGSHANSAAIGKAMCDSSDVRALSFTGSTRVGKLLYRQCANTAKKLSLEMGGNAPFIVFDSADLELAIPGCMASKFRNAGQTCVSANRVLVQAGIHDEFVARLAKAMEAQIVVGNGKDASVSQGPLINKRQFDRVVSLVDSAKKSGVKVVTGGDKHKFGDLYYQPTILTGVKKDMDCFAEEIFGPVVSVLKFDKEEEALAIANDCDMGLAAYFFSRDVSQCFRVAKRIEAGMVGINDGMVSCCEGAFGGVKESGIGREGSKYGIEEYTEMKTITFGNLS